MQTPPLPASEASTSSGTLRGWSQTARAELWLKIAGAVATASASRITSAETCERSTNMPIRFISRTTSRPKSESPPSTGSSVAESAQGTFSLWVSVMYRTPRACIIRSVPSEELIECPPSMPLSEAIRPARIAASTSSAVRHRARSSGNASTSRCTKSTCSSVAVTAASPASEHGTNTDQNWPATPPARSRGRSVCTAPSPPARSTFDRS